MMMGLVIVITTLLTDTSAMSTNVTFRILGGMGKQGKVERNR
jgi:hypothetical protein